MHAHGSDRVRVAPDGRILLVSRLDKGWNSRVEKTLTTAQFPGTAVLWEDAYYEVVAVETMPVGVRYVLAPWLEQHAIRIADRYDAESEAHRIAEHEAALRRERARKGSILFGFVLGLLPAVAQEQLASELGLIASRMTTLSLLPVLAAIAAVILWFVNAVTTKVAGPPFSLIVFAAYLAIESSIRFHAAWSQSRPMGSIIGYVFYIALWPFFRRRLPSPFEVKRGEAVPITDAPDDVALRDTITMRAPLMTLLTANEQRALADRYGYNYREHARNIAILILAGSAIGVFTSWRSLSAHGSLGAALSLIVASVLTIEQLIRLASFARGPRGSILGVVARPFVRKLLA